MGFVPLSRSFLDSHIHVVGGYAGRRMMELGNQQMYCHADVLEASSAKPWFTARGVSHTSVDLNGKDGAHVIDLSTLDATPAWQKAFDIVTDFGTSEHVGPGIDRLHACRSNCHNWCRPGGLLVFMNPKTGHWPLHGWHFFTQAHYAAVAGRCGYKVLEISEHPSLGNFKDGWQIHAAFQKLLDVDFPSFEAYSALCAGTVFTS